MKNKLLLISLALFTIFVTATDTPAKSAEPIVLGAIGPLSSITGRDCIRVVELAVEEINAVLMDHPTVTASCVVGVPDEKVGERTKAFVVLKEDVRGATAYDLIKWCRRRLPAYKVPQYIEFRDMLPKSKVGKLLRREMRDEELRKRREGGGPFPRL